MELSASLEDYLEAILWISNSKGAARGTDISDRLAVKRPSVTGALKLLAERGLVHYAPYDVVTLTDEGRKIAETVAHRHEVLRSFLSDVLQLDAKTAEATACQFEHGISELVVERFVHFIEHVHDCPRGGYNWVNGFAHRCAQKFDKAACESCIEQCLVDLRSTEEPRAVDAPPVPLAALPIGQKASVVSLPAAGAIRRRLLDMGVVPGVAVEIERIAPLGDPIDVKIKGYHLSLRKEEAAMVLVKRVGDAVN